MENKSFFKRRGMQAGAGRGHCASCGLYKQVKSPQMQPFGNFKKRILNVGEAPGEFEDERGKQWQGKMGRELQRVYSQIGVDLFEDCLNINAVNCRPITDKGSNRTPESVEIACCRGKVLDVIEQYQPHVIMLLGACAVESVIGSVWKKDLGGISKWRGFTIPDRSFKAWVCPTYHPSFVKREKNYAEGVITEKIWMDDLRRALTMMDTPFPDFPDESKQVELIEDRDAITAALKMLNHGEFPPDGNFLTLDLETTGLKPQDTSRHQIACMAFCENPGRAIVFPAPWRRSQKEALRALLQNERRGKVAANMKFEDTWLRTIYGIPVSPWAWDTMQAAHIIDNRPDITSLKFQAYVNFGVADYSSELDSYLKADDKNANSVNRVMELMGTPAGRVKLMTYCGMDALFTYRLAIKQRKEIGIG